MRKKKNRFLVFCFSFIPGAGELYLGFMNMGMSLLFAFAVSMIFVSFMNIGILSFMPCVVWIYSFFHANNLGGLSDEEFYNMEDTYLFGLNSREMESLRESFTGRFRKAAAIVLIIIGISMLWDVANNFICYIVGGDFYNAYIGPYVGIVNNELPQLVISMVIIWFGVRLIRGKKVELDEMEAREEGMGGSAYRSMGRNVNGSMGGSVNGSMYGNADGSMGGSANGSMYGNADVSMGGSADVSMGGNADGNMNGNMDENSR